jgi:hypothetical protein
MRITCLLLLLFAFCATNAQNTWLSGFLRDSVTHFPVKGTLTNAATRQQVQTGANGFFRIQASPGQVIYAVAPSYRFDTLKVPTLFADTLVVFLAPTGIMLGNVTVQAQYTKYQLDSIERRQTFETLRGNDLKRVSRANEGGFGVGLNLDRVFKDKYRNQRKKEQFFERREQDAYVDFYFSPHLVAQYTGLKGDALRLFMYRFRPDYEWLRNNHSHDALLFYINNSLKKFRAVQR